MSTVQKIQAVVQRLQKNYIPKAKARRFSLGIQSLALREFGSLNAAGRASSLNRWTGESRMRRVVTDDKLADKLQTLLVRETLVNRSGYLYCSMDHSQFGPFCIAVLAVSFRKGRAVPVWCQVNVSEAALIKPLLAALEQLFIELQQIAPSLKPVLVMDRWFASDKLFTLFEKYHVYFIARTKSDKCIQLPWDTSWQLTPVKEVSQLEVPIAYRKHHLRLIRSELRPGMKDPEPWFLLTNLPDKKTKSDTLGVSRTQVLHRYAERFEIEEAFKDVKWLQRLEWQQVRKPAVMRCLLLFTFLGWWILWICKDLAAQRANLSQHVKKRLSWFRVEWENLQRACYMPLSLLA
jgi:hypothetical protein